MRSECRRGDSAPKSKQEHLEQCRDCGTWVNVRDLEEVLAHVELCDGTPPRLH